MMTINADRTKQAGNETEELHIRLMNKGNLSMIGSFTMF